MKIVVKIGGQNIDFKNESYFRVLAQLAKEGIKLALVHGGGAQITEFLEKEGRESQFVEGLRVTSPQDMEIIEMVLSGLLNKMLVGIFHHQGVPACGISGRDGFLLEGEKYYPTSGGEKIDLGRVGEIKKVNPRLVHVLWEGGFLPVISPVAADKEGESLNVNADWAAARLAVALQADKLLFFSDTPGVLRDIEDRDSLIETLSGAEIETLKKEGKIHGGMIPKLKMAEEALRGGVKEVFIGEGKEMENLPLFLAGGKIRGTKVVL
ncbi:MAG TPA: acetylglutamate kinase [Candidatus Atribacteria bacterium]|nr:acetylglutamate kinase [Candidatus Atribacteria bacterium]